MSKTIYKDPARFYVYAFLREDGTPYYIGKGQGNRAWCKRRFRPVESSRISILFENLSESEAFDEEIRLIQFYGRKDLGTGILRNKTDGGEGVSGYKYTPEALDKRSGEKSPMYGKTGEKSPRYGKNHTPETKAEISAALLGKRKSEIHRKKMGLSKLGNTYVVGQKRTDKQKKNMSESKLGSKNPSFNKKQSEETKKKRSASLIENKNKKNNKGGKWYNDGTKNIFIKVKDLEHIDDTNHLLIPGRIISLKQKSQMVETRKNNRLSRISDNKV
jgi:hypothetical protein